MDDIARQGEALPKTNIRDSITTIFGGKINADAATAAETSAVTAEASAETPTTVEATKATEAAATATASAETPTTATAAINSPNDEKPRPTIIDFTYVCALIIIGFFSFEWNALGNFVPFNIMDGGSLSTTLFFLALIATTFIYLQLSKIKQSRRSLVALVVAILGALPFVLYGTRNFVLEPVGDFNLLISGFEICACITWVMLSTKTSLSAHLRGTYIFDMMQQAIVTPFMNYGKAPWAIFKIKAPGERKFLAPIAITLISLCVCLPIFWLVMSLLTSSDAGFAKLSEDLSRYFMNFDFGRLPIWTLELCGAVFITMYIYGSVYGNSKNHYCNLITEQGCADTLKKSHLIPRLAFYAPLALLLLIYIVYFVVMGNYLFGALGGELAGDFTYAEYARQGFFELCGVALTNLCILGVVYWFAKREVGTYPKLLRLFTGLISLATCLLIITAASKMLLYVNIYDLSPLRLYTLCFMGVLLLVFLALCVWHIKPFNVMRAIIAVCVAGFLALSLSNTDGFIAEHNVNNYLSGKSNGQDKLIDTETLSQLSDAVKPALAKLRDNAPDKLTKAAAIKAIEDHEEMSAYRFLIHEETDENDEFLAKPWYYFNVQSYLARDIK